AGSQDDVGPKRDQFRRGFTNTLGIVRAPTEVDAHVAAVGPAQFLQPLQECREAGLCRRIVGRGVQEHPDPPPPLALRSRREPAPRRRAAEKRDEVAAFDLRAHSITSSARPISGSGTVMPSAWAVLRLMISSTFVDCWTGKSAGLSPLRTLPT